jgi:hypothetical protein
MAATYFNNLKGRKGNELIPETLGCCNGGLKFSYVISAPLHMNGFFDFWGDEDVGPLGKFVVSCDLVFHVAFWLIPLIIEFSAAGHDKGSFVIKELQAASLWSLVVALCGMFIAQVFAMLAGGQPAGRLFPSTYGLIVGGAYASIIFSILYIQAAMGTWAEYTASDDDSNEVAQMRKLALWGLVFKALAVVTLKQNAAFWGPCSTDVMKENEDRRQQLLKAPQPERITATEKAFLRA